MHKTLLKDMGGGEDENLEGNGDNDVFVLVVSIGLLTY